MEAKKLQFKILDLKKFEAFIDNNSISGTAITAICINDNTKVLLDYTGELDNITEIKQQLILKYKRKKNISSILKKGDII